jgi:site-specific DNA-methyltransferase (adenine-specific)
MLDIGFLMRGEVIWRKAKADSGSCAWGTYKKADNPVLRDVHEYLLVFCKGRFGRVRRGTSTITAEEFRRATTSVWDDIAPASARRIGHPAPFPAELPERCIQLYTYLDDLVLDPFLGSGSTAVAATRTGRHYVGYEISQEYADLARKRIGEAIPAIVENRAKTEGSSG